MGEFENSRISGPTEDGRYFVSAVMPDGTTHYVGLAKGRDAAEDMAIAVGRTVEDVLDFFARKV